MTPPSSQNLGKVVLRSSLLQFVSKIVLRGLKFIRTLILAKLLFPEAFGLFVLASVCMGFVDTFVQSGFQNALVQRDHVDRSHLDGAWTLHIVKGIVLGAVMFLSAPFLADFFNEPQLTAVVQVLSVMLALDGFVNMGAVLFQKEFQFGKKLLYDFSYNLSEMIATIAVALWWPSVWALVVGTLVGRVAAVVFSYVFHPYRPRITLNFSGARELFHFGKWMWIGAVITFFVSRGDGVVIGKVLSTEDLGYYQLAFSLALLPALEIVRSLGVVLFPLFSRLKDSAEKLTETFIRSSQMLMLMILPISAGLYCLAEPVVRLLYGARWLPMVAVLKILILYGVFKSIEYVVTPVLLGLGRPKIPTISMAIHASVLLLTLVPFTHLWGIEGTALSLLCAAGVSTLALCIIFLRLVPITQTQAFTTAVIPLCATGVMIASLFAYTYEVAISSLPLLASAVVVGALVYAGMVFICDRISGRTIYGTVLWMLRTIR